MGKNRWFVFSSVLLALSWLAGCATPVDKSEITPKVSAAQKTLAVTVVEARHYVLTGNRTPKFEGVFRSAFGIPVAVERPNRPKEERFVDYLADMIKDGLTEAGVKVSLVPMPNGASLEDTLKKMADTGAGRYVVIRVNESNWDAGGLSGMFSYKYDFAMYVGGPAGFQTRGKTFAASEANKASDKYNIFDMHSVRYREILETMFRDPEMQAALK